MSTLGSQGRGLGIPLVFWKAHGRSNVSVDIPYGISTILRGLAVRRELMNDNTESPATRFCVICSQCYSIQSSDLLYLAYCIYPSSTIRRAASSKAPLFHWRV